jgi:hypothetical protein
MNKHVSPRDVQSTDPTQLQSYSYIILNKIYDRLVASTSFKNFAIKRITRAMPIEASYHLPYIGIYLGTEKGSNPNFSQATIQFSTRTAVFIQIVIRNNDDIAALMLLDQAKWFVLNQLLCDDTLTNLYQTPPIQGFPEYRIPAPEWGAIGAKNEIPIGIQLIELTFEIDPMFYPAILDELKEIVITTGFPGPGATPEEREAVQQVTVRHVFNPDYVPLPYPDAMGLPDGVTAEGKVGKVEPQST